ncbi:MAG: type I restriction enzyme HsdR N-terminal domain-containing protein [Gammaproteobacteria bacterium]|nr:type I restriction enzyme HsdR N-terminal domain-containing protein [Gammaproteobacteria bacterium]MDE0251325.1 type I restriction enzyme HsdR N-terminal domain-containing protein [Gammaproteobacteria bacterium]MDE0401991.1 type I restriction enzyme HsdR N-terminal domain-containing protein [Gammaproteobacteria bacterium]
MVKEALIKFEEQLKEYAEKMHVFYTHCENEEQTKKVMIEPFLKLLDYDVSDPRIAKLEYPVSPTGGGTRVDYALFCDNMTASGSVEPRILIEAKAASNDLTKEHLLRQISDYADLVSSVEFVALTNGRIWQWFRKEKNHYGDRKLSHRFFLSHDVFTPLTRNSKELRFLKKISLNSFDSDLARTAADEVRISDVILDYLEEIKDEPGADLRKLIFKKGGLKWSKRESEMFEKVWPECIETFIESQARKLQLDVLLQESKQANEKTEVIEDKLVPNSPVQSELHSDEGDTRSDTTRSFLTEKGEVNLDARKTKRAWKPSQQNHWNIENSGNEVLLSSARYLVSIHSSGKEHLLTLASNLLVRADQRDIVPKSHRLKLVCDGVYLNTNLNNDAKVKVIKELERYVSPNFAVQQHGGALVDIWMPTGPRNKGNVDS